MTDVSEGVRIVPFESAHEELWDALVRKSPVGTFLHTRRFLGYHGDRFQDASVTIELDGDLAGVFPAALDPGDASLVVSHPGATYGGLVLLPEIRGGRVISILTAIVDHYRKLGHGSIRYRPVPSIYHRGPWAEDGYALHRLGAQRTACGLSVTIDLAHRAPMNERRRRDIKSRLREGVAIRAGREELDRIWPIVESNRLERHGVRPTHTLTEIASLQELFPSEISAWSATLDGDVLAGAVVFHIGPTDHLQYVANSAEGRLHHTQDVLVEHLIDKAGSRGARFFDFGISTTDKGAELNEGLHRYKSSFGGGSTLYEEFGWRMS